MADAANFMTPEQMEVTPAGVPPPGVIPNFVNPPTVGYNVIGVVSALVAIAFTFVALRLYTAIAIKRKMLADDWTTVASVIGTIYFFTTLCLAVTKVGFGTHMYNLSIAHLKSAETAKISYLTNAPAHVIWPCIKSTFFLMYLQLFRPLKWLRVCSHAGLIVTWVGYMTFFGIQLYYTSPAPGQSFQQAFAGPRYLKSFKFGVPTACMSLILDVYIFILPLIAVSSLKLSFTRKLGVVAMFSTGFTACLASSVSVYFQQYLVNHKDDYLYYVVYVILCYLIEMCVGISVACMPSVARLHKDKGPKIRSFMSSMGFPTRIASSTDPKSTGSKSRPKRRLYAFQDDSLLITSSSTKSETPRTPAPVRQVPDDQIHLTVNISQTSTVWGKESAQTDRWVGSGV